MELNGMPVLERVYKRCQMASTIDRVIVLTSVEESDAPIVDFCNKNGLEYFRGPLNDVLKRYWDAVDYYKLENFIRVTADCPLIEPSILDCLNIGGISNSYDYYGLFGNFPDGLDCTFISRRALNDARIHAKLPSEREHVGPYIEKRLNSYKHNELKLFESHLNYRLTLDTYQDAELISQVLLALERNTKNEFNINEVLRFLDKNPEIYAINKSIIRNEGYQISLEREKNFHLKKWS